MMTLSLKLRAWAAPALLAAALVGPATADPGHLTVQVNKPGVKISPLFYGLMTEEINHAFDGGLYGELIQNRAFRDDPKAPAHWSAVTRGGAAGTIMLDTSAPVPGTALTTCLRLDIASAGAGGRVGAANDGYWGIPVRPNTTYHASFYAKASPNFTGPLTVDIENGDGKVTQATAQVTGLTADWKRYTATLTTGDAAPTTEARFVLSAASPGTVWLSQVSLMPPTLNSRPNGTRPDLMRLMGGLKPSFLRLPGGNYLEGNTLAERFDWKKTVGPIESRPGHQGPWGYRSTDGMGLLEMLDWCEDLKMQPLLAVFAGYALGGEHVAPGPALAPFVQDALDEIEYVTGSASSRWGARRVAHGHPAPFPLAYVEVGNEDTFDRSGSYSGRYAQFYDAIKAKYPALQIIATARVKGHAMDVLDDHYYRSAADMARDSGHYDAYDRKGPKIFVGEWASTEGSPTPTMQAALGDAAWLTGLERNSDLVILEAYAPLLVNVNPGARQWGTNLIGYDALSSFGSPSYYVQKLFAENTGDTVLPVTVTPPPAPIAAALPLPSGKIGVATWATQAEFKDIQVTQGGKTLYQKDFAQGAGDWTLGQGEWKAEDGVLRQSDGREGDRATAGDAAWTDYTYHVQARKLGGREGFLIAFHYKDDANLVWWNVGGWGNTYTALQLFHNGSAREAGRAPVTVETNRWYDIKIEVAGRQIRCFLDGKLVSEATDTPPAPPAPLYAAASRDTKTGDVIVKVVNTSASAQQLQVDLTGARGVGKSAAATVLAGEPSDVNSLDTPEKVAPRAAVLTGIGAHFVHEFPAHSVTVLRIKARK